MERELPLRITIVRPPAGARFRIQRGRDELIPPSHESNETVSFELTVRLGTRPDGEPNFLGPLTHGPPDGRFLYINSGTLAGQTDSCWTRRAKVRFSGITWSQIEEVLGSPGARLEARIHGTGKDGGPACASVPLLGGSWEVWRS